jgi:hypothetical protein
MKKSLLVFMLIANLIPQETFGANGSRLPEMYSFLNAQALVLMEKNFAQNDKEIPHFDSKEYKSAHYGLTLSLGSALHNQFPCETPRHHMDCAEIQPILESIAHHFLQIKVNI